MTLCRILFRRFTRFHGKLFGEGNFYKVLKTLTDLNVEYYSGHARVATFVPSAKGTRIRGKKAEYVTACEGNPRYIGAKGKLVLLSWFIIPRWEFIVFSNCLFMTDP